MFSFSEHSDSSLKKAGFGTNFDIILLSTLVNILSLAIPIVLLMVYDRILPNRALSTATVLFIGAFIALLIEGSLRFARTYLLSLYAESFEYASATQAMRILFNSDIAAAMNTGAGTLKQRLADIGSLREYYSGQSSLALFDLPFSLLFLGAIWYIGAELVVIPLLLYMVAALCIILVGRNMQTASRDTSDAEDDRINFITNILNTLTAIKCLGGERQALRIFRGKTKNLVRDRTRLDRLGQAVADFISLLGSLTTIATLAVGAILVMNGYLTTGGLAACTILAGRSLGPVISLMVLWTQLQRTWVARDRIDELWELKQDGVFNHKSGLTPENGSIRMDNVQVYRGEKSYTFNVDIKPGQKLILDDPAGDRLPLFLGLLMGSFMPDQGVVEVGGRPLADYSRNSYRRSVAFISPRSQVFRGSILDNISLYQPGNENLAIELSAQLGLTSFIHSLPNGFRTQVGDKMAGQLDTGTIQRIALTRALVNRPFILVLNEADEGVDLTGKQMLGQLLKKLEDITILVLPSDSTLRDVFNDKLDLEAGCAVHPPQGGLQ